MTMALGILFHAIFILFYICATKATQRRLIAIATVASGTLTTADPFEDTYKYVCMYACMRLCVL